jgi:hypothetical protein
MVPVLGSGRTTARLALILVTAQLGSGCASFLAHGPPPKAQRAPGFTCTESPVWPVADIALSVLSLGETIHAAARERTPWPWLGASLVFGVSGGLGAGRVNACNKAKGHPYSPRSPTAQPGMMPEEPFGMKGAHPQKPPTPDLDDEPEVESEADPGVQSPKPEPLSPASARGAKAPPAVPPPKALPPSP